MGRQSALGSSRMGQDLTSAFHPLRTFAPSEMNILMPERDRHWSLSNPGPEKLLVWLEPWAEEFEIPVRSTVALRAPSVGETRGIGEVEWTADHLVVWSTAPGTVEVFIDGVLQDSGSAVAPVPNGLSKQMLNLLFADHPSARLAGRSSEEAERMSWWRRVRSRFGL